MDEDAYLDMAGPTQFGMEPLNDSTDYADVESPIGNFTESMIDDQIRLIENDPYTDTPVMYFPSSDPAFSSGPNLTQVMPGNSSFNFGSILDGFNKGISGAASLYATVEKTRGYRDQVAIQRQLREGNRAVTQANIERDVVAGVAGVPLRKGLGFNGQQTSPIDANKLDIQKIALFLGIVGAVYVLSKKIA